MDCDCKKQKIKYEVDGESEPFTCFVILNFALVMDSEKRDWISFWDEQKIGLQIDALYSLVMVQISQSARR